MFPEPYLGNPDAPILLLNLNPGYGHSPRQAHAHAAVGRLCIANLRHGIPRDEFPFYPLHPDYMALAQTRWWPEALQGWIEDYGCRLVARAFFCIEFFPYASLRYKRLPEPLPSQEYSIELARAKIDAGCVVVAMRHARQWAKVLEVSGDDWIRPRSPQQKSLNPSSRKKKGNLDRNEADRIRAVLESLR